MRANSPCQNSGETVKLDALVEGLADWANAVFVDELGGAIQYGKPSLPILRRRAARRPEGGFTTVEREAIRAHPAALQYHSARVSCVPKPPPSSLPYAG